MRNLRCATIVSQSPGRHERMDMNPYLKYFNCPKNTRIPKQKLAGPKKRVTTSTKSQPKIKAIQLQGKRGLRIEPEALRKLMKEALGDKVEEVNVSNRMVDSLRVLTMSEHSLPDHESRGGGSRDPTVAVRQENLV